MLGFENKECYGLLVGLFLYISYKIIKLGWGILITWDHSHPLFMLQKDKYPPFIPCNLLVVTNDRPPRCSPKEGPRHVPGIVQEIGQLVVNSGSCIMLTAQSRIADCILYITYILLLAKQHV